MDSRSHWHNPQRDRGDSVCVRVVCNLDLYVGLRDLSKAPDARFDSRRANSSLSPPAELLHSAKDVA